MNQPAKRKLPMNKINTTCQMMSAILVLGYGTSNVGMAACWTAEPKQCAKMNETTCEKGRADCAPNSVTAMAAADAYIYPAKSVASGMDKTMGWPGCMFPAYYLGSLLSGLVFTDSGFTIVKTG
jgi:hypothetical protein